MQQAKHVAAGVLPLFDNGKTVLLGREYRKRYDGYFWMEFGGKHEVGETLAETACREANEETAQTLGITLTQVQEAEQLNQYVEYYNPKTSVFYRTYYVYLDQPKPCPKTFEENAIGKSHVEMVEWRYFNTTDVLNNKDGTLEGTDVKLYETNLIRIAMLKEKGVL